MVDKLKNHIEQLKKFDRQRLLWLYLSGGVFFSIIAIVVDFVFFDHREIYWSFVPIGLLLSVLWWYWTMRFVRLLLTHRIDEVQILGEIVADIKDIKKDVKNLNNDS